MKPKPLPELSDSDIPRFWNLVAIRDADDCWPWQAYTTNGRGRFQLKGRPVCAPRVAWTIANGTIPDDMHVCHHCDNPICVNPKHLFIGTNTDNVRDSVAKKRHAESKKTHCPIGHKYTSDNTYINHRNHRRCRACARLREQSQLRKTYQANWERQTRLKRNEQKRRLYALRKVG